MIESLPKPAPDSDVNIRAHNRPRLNWWFNDLDGFTPGSPQEVMFIEGQKLEGSVPISGKLIDLLEDPARLATHKKLLGILSRMRKDYGDPYKALHHFCLRQDSAADLVALEDAAAGSGGSTGAKLLLGLVREAKKAILDELDREGFVLVWGETERYQTRKAKTEEDRLEDCRVFAEECRKQIAEGATHYTTRAHTVTAKRVKRAISSVKLSISKRGGKDAVLRDFPGEIEKAS